MTEDYNNDLFDSQDKKSSGEIESMDKATPSDDLKKEISQNKKEPGNMPFLDHLEELRKRLLRSFAAIIIMSILAFAFSDYILRFLLIPLGDTKLYFTEIAGSFYAYMKISLYAGLFLSLPIVFYQLWRFVSPGLYKTEKSIIVPLVAVSTILFLGGAAFCFFGVMPFAISFLLGYGNEFFSPIITISSYTSFVGLMTITFGFIFQLPVIGYFLGKIGLVTGEKLRKWRPYSFVVILIVAGILTPPDIFSQILMAGPMYILYEITILVVRISGKKKKTEDS